MTSISLQKKFNKNIENLGPFEINPHVAVAVSGGSDSLALILLIQKWIEHKSGQVTALIVDHGLRPESGQEAQYTSTLLKSFKISSVILKRDKNEIVHRIQEQARSLRYSLMTQWCAQNGVLHLCLGHHLEDQQETFLIRQQKESKDLGLASMSCSIEMPYIRVLRPLLTFEKQELRNFLVEKKISYIEDPSNINLKFTRVQIRQRSLDISEKQYIQGQLKDKGIHRIQQETYINNIIFKCIKVFDYGYGILEEDYFKKLSSKDQQHVMQRCLMTFGVGPYPARQESVKNLIDNLGETKTLKGCLIQRFQKNIYIFREPEKIQPLTSLKNLENDRWDERWQIIMPLGFKKNSSELLKIGPLGKGGWQEIKNTNQAKKLKFLPAYLRFGLPSLWQEEKFKELLNFVCSKFTNSTKYGIYFLPRYPLTRFTFNKFD